MCLGLTTAQITCWIQHYLLKREREGAAARVNNNRDLLFITFFSLLYIKVSKNRELVIEVFHLNINLKNCKTLLYSNVSDRINSKKNKNDPYFI